MYMGSRIVVESFPDIYEFREELALVAVQLLVERTAITGLGSHLHRARLFDIYLTGA